MRKGRDGGKTGEKTGKKEKTDEKSGHYVVFQQSTPRRTPPERRPLARRTLVPIELSFLPSSAEMAGFNLSVLIVLKWQIKNTERVGWTNTLTI